MMILMKSTLVSHLFFQILLPLSLVAKPVVAQVNPSFPEVDQEPLSKTTQFRSRFICPGT